MNDAEYLHLRRQIESEYSQNLDALNRVWRLANGSSEPPTPSLAMTGELRSRSGRGEIMTAIRENLNALSGNFTWKAIRDRLSEARPELPANRTTISQVLRKLTDLGEINEVESGRGKRPAIYCTIQPPEGQTDELPPPKLATEEQIAEMRSLCTEGGYTVEEFKAEFIYKLGYDKVGKMPRRLVEAVLKDVRIACEARKQASET
jgi:hypothetical protein